jgi:CrcB protein
VPDAQPRGWTADRAVDPDIDLHVSEQRAEWRAHRWVLPAASVGGLVGASARYLVEQALPHDGTGWPMATFLTNVTGCFLLGALMALLTVAGRGGTLLRIFLGVGVLGGYTTFSTYAVQAGSLMDAGAPLVAAGYLVASAVAACTAVLLGLLTGRVVVRPLVAEERG